MKRLTTPAERYGFAVLVIAATLLLRSLMAPLWETTAPFALFMFAAVIAAWVAGTGPALLTGAAGLGTRLYFDSPGNDGMLPVTWEEAVRLTLFAGFIGGAAVILDRMKSDRRQLEQSMAAAQAEIAERRRIEQTLLAARAEAEEANRLKDEFLAIVSHELRTPLNAILGWVTLLRAGNLSAPRTTHALEVVQRNARVQAQLVGDLLDVAQSLTGRLHLDPSKVDLVPLTVAAAASVRDEASEKGVELQVEAPPESLTVWGDPERLQQVVFNLLANAIKFTPSGGRASLIVRRDGGFAEVVVSDTGVGIAPDFLPQVFERFRQADTGSTRRHGGLGLGLAIVRQLVELHRGHIEADSDGVGRGARFIVRLPLHRHTTDPDDQPPYGRETAPKHLKAVAAPARLGSYRGT
ncbi:hypothetical protein BH23ACI1_BH23ACI1_25160 [soil metagenome]